TIRRRSSLFMEFVSEQPRRAFYHCPSPTIRTGISSVIAEFLHRVSGWSKATVGQRLSSSWRLWWLLRLAGPRGDIGASLWAFSCGTSGKLGSIWHKDDFGNLKESP